MRKALSTLLLLSLVLAVAGCDGKAAGTPDTAGFQGLIDDFDLEEYRGRVVLLNFWATWCGPCRMEIPILVQLRKDFDDSDLAIIGISVDGQSPGLHEEMVRFLDRFEVNYPVYLDASQSFAGRFDPTGHLRFVPTTVLIDESGKIRDTHYGVPRNARGQADPYRTLATQIQHLLDD